MHNLFNYFFEDSFLKHTPSKDVQIPLETEKARKKDFVVCTVAEDQFVKDGVPTQKKTQLLL